MAPNFVNFFDKHINTFCGKKLQYLNIKPSVTCLTLVFKTVRKFGKCRKVYLCQDEI